MELILSRGGAIRLRHGVDIISMYLRDVYPCLVCQVTYLNGYVISID